MNSLAQYLDLYKDNREVIERSTPNYLKNLRERAWTHIQDKSLPDKHIEGYERTSINDMFAPNLGINIERKNLIGNNRKFHCGAEIPNAVRVTVNNDVPVRIEIPHGKCFPEGLEISSFVNVSSKVNEELISNALENVIGLKDNASQLLNILLGTDGLLIIVHENCSVDLPVQIVNYSGGPIDLLSNRRLIIYMEPNSRLNLLNCDHSLNNSKENRSVINNLIYVSLSVGSELKFADMEESDNSTQKVSNIYFSMESDSHLSYNSIVLKNGITRNNIHCDCRGDNSVLKIDGLVIGKNDSATDNYIEVSHAANHQKSEQLFKYALFDGSKGAFGGKIIVQPNARFNEAFQNNRNIVISKEAGMYSKPQLLIYNDDVKCSHGATTGQLDQRAIYYMETRGISREEAQSMLLQAFMNDVVERMDFPGFSDRLKHLVERTLNGEDITCGSCKIHDNA